MEIPEEAMALINTHASTGNDVAKSILTDLGKDIPPAKTEDPKPVETAPAEATPEAEMPKEDAQKVDQGQVRNGKAERKPSKIDTIRELRRKRRELESLMEERESGYHKKIEELSAKVDSLLQNGKQKQPEDALTSLLENPDNFLSKREAEREQRLVEQMRKLIQESQMGLSAISRVQSERAEADKLLKSVEGFDLTENEDDLLDLLEDYGYEQKDVYEMAEKRPMQFAKLAKKVWLGRNSLPAETVAAKSAATASAAISGKTPVGPKPTLKELNSQYALANARGDAKAMERIMSEISSFNG